MILPVLKNIGGLGVDATINFEGCCGGPRPYTRAGGVSLGYRDLETRA